jgi:hypothetical protein
MIRLDTQKRRPVQHVTGRHRGLRGLGFDYYDLLNASGIEQCDPRDTECTMRNAQRANAVEDLWTSTYMQHADTATQATPQINVNLDTSQAALNAYNANQPLTTESITVNGGPTYTDKALEQAYQQSAPAAADSPPAAEAPRHPRRLRRPPTAQKSLSPTPPARATRSL